MYGGRGVVICEKWMLFDGFYEDMFSTYKESLTLDRKAGGTSPYCKDNCRWATPKQQSLNTCRNVFLSFRGITQTVSEWSECLGMEHNTLRTRIVKLKWSIEKALTVPVRESNR